MAFANNLQKSEGHTNVARFIINRGDKVVEEVTQVRYLHNYCIINILFIISLHNWVRNVQR